MAFMFLGLWDKASQNGFDVNSQLIDSLSYNNSKNGNKWWNIVSHNDLYHFYTKRV